MIGKLQRRLPVVTDDPLELSARVIDAGTTEEATNRVINKVSPLIDGVALVESFSHIVAFATDDGLVCFDSSGEHTGAACAGALREWSTEPVHTLVYTHGHIDHVGGSGALAADAAERGHRPPVVVGHEAVAERFRRYERTNGYNLAINARQFGGVSKQNNMAIGGQERFLPSDVLWPTEELELDLELDVGGLRFELHHDRGETDDHLWAWVPSHRALCVGDFVTWVFPNCGNPQKVQRYPLEWAAALRKMQSYGAELLLGAHGLPVKGTQRVDRVLDDLATALETLVGETLEMMNAGASLDTIVHSVTLPESDLSRPWMRPVYDEPEFVVRNIWRLYGGWWDQDPAHLKPAPAGSLAAELVALAGGIELFIERAEALAGWGELRLACHLVELAVQAEPGSIEAHGARAEIYQARRDAEAGLMSKGVFAAAARESRAHVEGGQTPGRG